MAFGVLPAQQAEQLPPSAPTEEATEWLVLTEPAGRPLFLPAFNMWHCDADGPPPHLPRAFGTLAVDDVPVELDVIATPLPFEVAGARSNPVTGTRKPEPVTVWGLWKWLDPLPAGEHVLQFTGGDGYGFTVAAVYHLSVA
ncbi:MAG TPA: hypothetical protein VFX60_12635 [Micromonospora sp.]|nr:hypothetical protein [Micromonospora sp.]